MHLLTSLNVFPGEGLDFRFNKDVVRDQDGIYSLVSISCYFANFSNFFRLMIHIDYLVNAIMS